ncbi:MAG: ATP-NAD kinase family protein [Anaerolineales bacterium]
MDDTVMTKKKIGFIINPVAGLGGRVGLKGSDGEQIQKKALSLGAQPYAAERAKETLTLLFPFRDQFHLLSAAATMGEFAAREIGFEPEIIPLRNYPKTTAQDTIEAAEIMQVKGVDLILFAGGDGTARDIYQAVQNKIPVVGIPAGVKIFSAVFAYSPKIAGVLVRDYITRNKILFQEAEVIDLDEDSYRNGVINTKLYGFMKIPFYPHLIQNQKIPSQENDRYQIEAIAHSVVEEMERETIYAIGPGTVPNYIGKILGIEKTLVGIDLLKNKTLIAKDVNEQILLEVLKSSSLKIIITPIGGQGFLFGRGNQPFSPRVLEKVLKKDIIVVSLVSKINALRGKPLRIDTGDAQIDQKFSGYITVITGYRDKIIYPVKG